MNPKMLLILLFSLSLLTPIVSSCTNGQIWVNCSITLNNTNPMGGVFQTVKTNFPPLFGLMWFAIVIFAFGLFRLFNPTALSAAYASFMAMIVAAVMINYNVLGSFFMDMSVGLFILSIAILFLFK